MDEPSGLKNIFACMLLLTAETLLADSRIGKWCESDDDGESCHGYVSYFSNGDVYAYGVFEDILYIATGDWRQTEKQSCLNLIYTIFDVSTEQPYPIDEYNFCNEVIAISADTFRYRTETGSIETMYRVSDKADHSMSPLPQYLVDNAGQVKPAKLSLDVPQGKYGLYPLPLQLAPANLSFVLSLNASTPPNNITREDELHKWLPYTYVQWGDPDNTHMRVSLHLPPESNGRIILMLEYHQPGQQPFKRLIADDIASGEQVLIQLAWQPDGTTTLSYKDQTLQYQLPLQQWQSYFMASNTKATFQRLAN
ncbi:hypothetical protein [Arsukibacterium sp.]|uniref:hypothetical protein n=1 Tax=Arsukibacterium sp. TaxID=1977258 RepID=UPI001BD4127F|nr:hypothetical protein [Arsukibacterium sp.]